MIPSSMSVLCFLCLLSHNLGELAQECVSPALLQRKRFKDSIQEETLVQRERIEAPPGLAPQHLESCRPVGVLEQTEVKQEDEAGESIISVMNAAMVSGKFVLGSGQVEQTAKCYQSSDTSCGFLEFQVSCSVETKIRLQSEVIAPDGASDSMWVWIKDVGERKFFGTGQHTSFAWSSTGPELTAPAGLSVLQISGREPMKIKSFKLAQGHPQCQWVQSCNDKTEVALLAPKDAAPYWEVQCCPVDKEFCAGCAKMNAGKTACDQCSGGYTKTSSGTCTACADVPGWENKAGENCYTASCSDELFQGFSSNTACCKCGGGQAAATKFTYYVGAMSLGSGVEGHPVPRTAQRYAVDQDCELSKYGLSIEPSTGALKLATGCSSVGCGATETIEVKCTVTAFQSNGLFSSAPLQVVAGPVGYGSAVVLRQGRRSAAPAASGTGSFAMQCAPEASDWLALDSSNGILSLKGAAAGGALTDPDHKNLGRGGVCTVSRGGAAGQVTVLAPQVWSSMSYSYGSNTKLYATVGERSPVLPVKGAQGIPPTRFAAFCAGNAFAFDQLSGVATYEGHVIFTVGVQTGDLQMQPEQSLTKTLDATDVNAIRRKITLQCTVLGYYEWLPAGQGPVLTHRLQVELRDETCWARKRLSFARRDEKGTLSHSQCRNLCRSDPRCSHYDTFGGKCYFFSALCRDLESLNCIHKNAWVTERFPGCGERGSCIDISLPNYQYMSGKYCPRGENIETSGQGPVYFNQGLTKQETFWLQRYDTGRNAGCHAGDWAVLKPDPEKDYENMTMGYVELHGIIVACVSSGQADLPSDVFGKEDVSLTVRKISVSGAKSMVAAPGCGIPNVTNEEKHEAEAEEDDLEVYPLVFDDPATDTLADHWLHPCECIPASWGGINPVAGESMAEVPAGSHNEFLPPPMSLLEGEFTCPQAGLVSIHVATDDDLYDGTTCKTLCSAQQCPFYWEGEVLSSKQCRIFNGCSELVREMGISGQLFGVVYRKSCRVANPEVCWKTTKRRSFLGAGDNEGGCFFEDLLQQCDHKLMLGGMGVSACGHCNYAPVQGRRITATNGMCMDKSGDNVKVHHCHGGANQRWYFEGEYLKTDGNDLCLDYHYGNGQVYMHTCHAGSNQKWYFDGAILKSRYDNKCLDFHPGDNNVYVGNCPGSDTQHFSWLQSPLHGGRHLVSEHGNMCLKFQDDGNVEAAGCNVGMEFRFFLDGEFLKSEKNPSMCLDYVTGNSQLQMYDCHGGTNQRFYFDGKLLKSRVDNRCIDWNIHGSNNVYMGNCPHSSTQKWGFHDLTKPMPEAQIMIMKENDLCLDAESGGNVKMHPCHGENNQKWYMDGMAMKNKGVAGCLDENGDGNLYMHTCHGQDNQKFWWEDGEFHNQKWGYAKCADMNGDRNIYMYECHGGANQKFNWKVPRRLKSMHSQHLCIAITNEWNAGLYHCNRNNDQLFYFEGGQLKNLKDTSKCLDMNSNGNLYLYNCHGGRNQKFFWAGHRLKVDSDWDKCVASSQQSGGNLETSGCHGQDTEFVWDDPHFQGRELKSQWSNECADSDGSNVYMHPCHGGSNQRFYWDGERLKLESDSNKCLDVALSAGNGNVQMYNCANVNNQRWYWDGQLLKSRHDNRCLDINTQNKNLFLGSCPDSGTQRFNWGEDLYNSRQLTIGGGRCLWHKPHEGDNAVASGCAVERGTLWYFNGEELKSLEGNKCLDIETGGNAFMYPCHGGSNQYFYFDGQLLKTRRDDRCLDYQVASGNVYTGSCPNQDTASFSMQGGAMLRKVPLPKEYSHGQTLDISCWAERYSSPSSESLSCVAGTWVNSRGKKGLDGFSCAACVQVVTPRYAELDAQIKQELYFAAGLQLHLTVDTRTRKSVTASGTLREGSNKDVFVAELLPDAPETERRYRSLTNAGQCLTETSNARLSSSACGEEAEPEQMLEVGELGALMWHEFQSDAEVPGPKSNYLYNRGSAPTTLRSFQLQAGDCGFHAMNSLGFNHGSQLGLSTSCTAASTYGDLVEHNMAVEGAVQVTSVNDGTCLSINEITPWELKDRHYSRCMDYEIGNNGNVHAHSCHGGSNQLWYMVEGAIISLVDGKCLDYHTGTTNVYMHECHGESNQRWYVDPDTAQIRSEYDHRCLDVHHSHNIYIHPCHGENNQKFDRNTKHNDKFNLALHLQCSGAPGEDIKIEPIGGQNKFKMYSGSHGLSGDYQYDRSKQRIKNLKTGKCLGSHAIFLVKEETCIESIQQEWVISHGLQGLADAPIECESNQVLSYIEKGHAHIRYKCVHVSALSSCNPGYSEQVDTKAFELEDIRALKHMSATCEPGHGLRSVAAEASDKGAWIRLKYECCRISRVPVSIYPFMNGAHRAFSADMAHGWEGMYCPAHLDDSGRMYFTQAKSFKPGEPSGVPARAASSSRPNGDIVSFHVKGKEISVSTHRGMNVMVLTSEWVYESFQSFDTYGDTAQSENLKNFINNLANGKIILVAVKDEASHRLSTAAKDALKSCGATKIDSISFRGSYALVGVKGGNAFDEEVHQEGTWSIAGGSRSLSYDKYQGTWCVTGKNCAVNNMVHPLDAALNTEQWHVVPVSDFDAIFQARGVKPLGGNTKRKPPPLIKFGASDPDYLPECKDESHPGSKRFKLELMNKEAADLDDENACKNVYGKAPVNQKMDEADGMTGWIDDLVGTTGPGQGGVTYKSVKECSDRDIVRELKLAKWNQENWRKTGWMPLLQDWIDGIGEAIPAVEIAPFGTGFEINPGTLGAIAAGHLLHRLEFMFDDKLEHRTRHFEQAGHDDCSPIQHGFARTFCDLHCIRDAVRKGDDAILRALEEAVEIIGKNTQLLLEHYVGESESGLLEEGEKLQKGIAASMAEMYAMAGEAALEPRASLAVTRAIQSFVQRPGNGTLPHGSLPHFASEVQQLQGQVAQLSQRKLSHTEEIQQHALQMAKQMGKFMEAQAHVLGVYHRGAEDGKRLQERLKKSWRSRVDSKSILVELEEEEAEQAMEDFDAMWWQLRRDLDHYLHSSQEYVDSTTQAVEMLQDYSRCTAGFMELKAAYARSSKAERKAHGALRRAWAAATASLGEMASKVVDGHLLQHLAAHDLRAAQIWSKLNQSEKEAFCHSNTTNVLKVASFHALHDGLFGQTQQQMATLFGELAMLKSRFQSGGLGEAPDAKHVDQASTRIVEALKESATAGKKIVQTMDHTLHKTCFTMHLGRNTASQKAAED